MAAAIPIHPAIGRLGVIALARPTFDVPFAEATAARAFARLDALGVESIGPRDLKFDADATKAAIADLKSAEVDAVLVLQVTFTDATMTVALAEDLAVPPIFWAFPEPRTGGRLRLNSLCGVNLAAHALSRRWPANPCNFLNCDPDSPRLPAALARALGSLAVSAPALDAPVPTPAERGRAAAAAETLRHQRIGVIGAHPDGFDTCAYDHRTLAALTGVEAETVALPALFDAARTVPAAAVTATRARVDAMVPNLAEQEAEPLDKSLRSYRALTDTAAARRFDGVAVRCWPEFFTDYGGAACGAMALLNEDGIPAACEADAYGTVTNLALKAVADQAVFLADLVDIDAEGDTGVLWHCGLAPYAMRDPEAAATATVHSNRRKPLLFEFPLAPGRVTLARLSQSKGRTRMVVGGAEMLRAPKSFSGTSGVVRFDRPAAEVLDRIVAEGLEHHYCFAYGDHGGPLVALAELWGLETVCLS